MQSPSLFLTMTITRFILLLQIFLYTGILHINGIPACPYKIPVNVGDSVVYIRLFGDEHNKRAETLDGYSLIQNSGEWYYAEKDVDGLLKSSAYKLSARLTEDCKHFLTNTQKHLTNNKEAQINNNIKKSLRSQNVNGNRRILVILMQYTDLSMVKSNNDFDALFNGTGYSDDGAQGSVRDFYTDVSYGQLQLVCDVIGPFTSKYTRKYYGENSRNGEDIRPTELFEEAIFHAIEHVSLKDYDCDGDGYIDNIHIVFAGHGEEAGASDDAIWSHETIFYKDYEIQGMKIDRYSCAPELRGKSGSGISRIGPHCHEIGHALGANDYYDTDYGTDGNFYGTGKWDIMASGSWNNEGITPADFNPYVKAYDFGWITLKDLPSGNVVILPSNFDSDNYYILKSSYSTDCYLLENRSMEKWGNGVPGKGLLIYHIHPEIASSGNTINTKSPQKCYVVCASSRTRHPDSSIYSYGEINTDGCPYPGSSNNTDFGKSSTPVAFFWDDEECGIELNNISIDAEGIIHLLNNSQGIGEEDTEGKRVFFEGFEDDEVKVSITKNSDNSFAPTWGIKTDPMVPLKFPEQPYAYEGSKSMQLSAKKVTEKAVSQFSFIIPKITEGSSLKLILYVNSFKPNSENPNIIRVGYRTKDYDGWHYSEIISSDNNIWKKFIVELPDNILPEIKIEGTAFAESVLAIDNLEVEEIYNNNSGIKNKYVEANGSIYMYSLSGIKQNNLKKGINIIRLPSGIVIKTISK